MQSIDVYILDGSSLRATADLLRDGLIDRTSVEFDVGRGHLEFAVWKPDWERSTLRSCFWPFRWRVALGQKWLVAFDYVASYDARLLPYASSAKDHPVGGMNHSDFQVSVQTYSGFELSFQVSRLQGRVTKTNEHDRSRLFKRLSFACGRRKVRRGDMLL